MMLSVPVLLSVIFIPTVSQFLQSSNLGGGVGCVVTKNKLFSSGNYIRDLTEPEVKVLIQYKKDMMAFKKKIAQAFENAEKLEEQKGTIPPIPVRPTMPAFCKGSDTVTYIFPGCSVQNYKLFIGKTFVRTLDSKERGKMDEFVQKMGEYQKNGTTPTEDLQKNLSFCIDFA